mmetsp:Transcript_31192/g.68476  ORF Transcript_31192/g.68476 Transcript_31192/m.68476 type:complete len:242 (+) Transcript_31192:916-1641(+)
MLSLQGQPCVLQHPLHRHDVGLPLRCHPHHPVHSLGHTQAIGHGQACHPHPNSVVRRHSQHSRSPNNHSGQRLKPHGQPPVPRHHQIIRLGVLPEPLNIHVIHPALLTIRTDRHGPVQALAQPGENWGPQVGLNPLKLSGGGDVVVLDALVGVDDGQHDHQKRRGRRGNHHVHRQHPHQHREIAKKCVLQLFVDGVDVLGESVDHPPEGGGVVEGHGNLEHMPEQGVVAGPRCSQAGLEEG